MRITGRFVTIPMDFYTIRRDRSLLIFYSYRTVKREEMTQIPKINVLLRVIFIRAHRWLSYARHVSFRRIDEIHFVILFSSRNLSVPEKWDAKIMRQGSFLPTEKCIFLFLLSFYPLVAPSLNPCKRI